MSDAAKLHVSELNVLKKEEEVLNIILSKYKNTLNALKVEELTLFKQLGQTQDRERQSRNTTPLSGGIVSSRPHSRTRVLSTESALSPAGSQCDDALEAKDPDVNKSALNLSAVPLIHRMLRDHIYYEEEDEEEEEEDDSEEEMEEHVEMY